jgi:hypothetical protein
MHKNTTTNLLGDTLSSRMMGLTKKGFYNIDTEMRDWQSDMLNVIVIIGIHISRYSL